MKKITDYIIESKGASPFDRDGSHGKHKDPLIDKKETRNERLVKYKNDKYYKECRTILDEIKEKSKILNTFDEINVFFDPTEPELTQKYSENSFFVISDTDNCLGSMFYTYDKLTSSQMNYIEHYFEHDKRLSKFFYNMQKFRLVNSYEASQFYIVKDEYKKSNKLDCTSVGIFFCRSIDDTYADYYKYLKENKDDIIYAIKKYCDLFLYLRDNDIDVHETHCDEIND